MSDLTNRLHRAGIRDIPPRKSGRAATLWEGPEEDGITFSLLSRFLTCRERFRLLVVEGLRPVDTFNHRIEFGNMWHACEEAKAAGRGWAPDLTTYARQLCERYRSSQEQVEHWYEVVRVTFPQYVAYWEKHDEETTRTPLVQEQVFDVPYRLPGGNIIRLRGKFDAVDLVGAGKKAGVYLMENKTKGEINELQIRRQLSFDLQTMMYLVALERERTDSDSKWGAEVPVRGVRYNVIRRPLSGGKGSIIRHKATKNKPEETKASYYSRLRDIIAEAPETYFMRWRVEVTAEDVQRFRRECLDPLLSQLCDWWDWVSKFARGDVFSKASSLHWRHPYGVRNILDEGGSSDLDEYLASGSEAGLTRVDELFGELR